MGTLTNYSFFSGVGGMDLGSKMAGGIQTVGYCEKDRYAQGVLRSRIKDGGLDDAPIWDDVTTFDGKPWRGVEIVSGGFPCQDVSVAGKRAGIEKGNRSGLFYELMRICREMGPRFILLENVAGLLVYPGAHRVFGELAEMGYDAGWKIISASDVGAPHQRQRIWIIAKPQHSHTDEFGSYRKEINEQGSKQRGVELRDRKNRQPRSVRGDVADASGKRPDGRSKLEAGKEASGGGGVGTPNRKQGGVVPEVGSPEAGVRGGSGENNWTFEPDVGRVVDGVAFRVDRLKCCGNGVVSQQSIPAWEEIKRLAKII